MAAASRLAFVLTGQSQLRTAAAAMLLTAAAALLLTAAAAAAGNLIGLYSTV
jgi:hypothetical protein